MAITQKGLNVCIKEFFLFIAGYGNLIPRTKWGKIATIVYAIIGMPLFLLYLSNIGKFKERKVHRVAWGQMWLLEYLFFRVFPEELRDL